MPKMQLDLNAEQIEVLVRKGIILGYTRENPRAAWTLSEKKECIRWTVSLLADRFIERDREFKT